MAQFFDKGVGAAAVDYVDPHEGFDAAADQKDRYSHHHRHRGQSKDIAQGYDRVKRPVMSPTPWRSA